MIDNEHSGEWKKSKMLNKHYAKSKAQLKQRLKRYKMSSRFNEV